MKHIFLLGFLSFSVLASEKLTDSIPFPFHEVQREAEGKSNSMMILNSGLASLELRLQLIREATGHIEVEYFIFGLDESSRLLTQELVLAAQRGVKVRMLIDKSAAVFEFDEYYAKVLSGYGIEVRYYNSAGLYRISSIQFRNHRKLISVDDSKAITGGRNIGNDYFDMSPTFNFLDTDVYVEGDIVKTMRHSFDEYFEAEISERPKLPKEPRLTKSPRMEKYLKRLTNAQNFIQRREGDQKLLEKVKELGQSELGKLQKHNCPETTYTTDRPGGNFKTRLVKKYSDDFRFVRKALFDKINEVDKSVTLASPYMINNKYSHSLMDDLLARQVDIRLYTNSLASTDAVYVAANLYLDVPKWTREGIKVHVHNGQYLERTTVLNDDIKKAKWGVHTKAQVYEYQDSSRNEIMIGTYNIDNRSNHYNNEMVLFCRGNDALIQEMKGSIEGLMEEGYEITSAGQAVDKNGNAVNVMGADPDNKLLMKLITLPSWLLKFLL